jgi:hypothetical protein
LIALYAGACSWPHSDVDYSAFHSVDAAVGGAMDRLLDRRSAVRVVSQKYRSPCSFQGSFRHKCTCRVKRAMSWVVDSVGPIWYSLGVNRASGDVF